VAFNGDDLIQAVKDGACLRLRPKVMTVPTIVASLLPIMREHSNWRGSDETAGHTGHRRHGSSLIHILIVTPVIFACLRERELNKQSEPTIAVASHRVASDSGRRKWRYCSGILISNLKKSPGSHFRFTSTRSCGSLSL